MAIEPGNPIIYYNIGVVYYKLNDYDKAIKYLKEALRINPDYDSAANALKMIQQINK
jgi:tetratricopeptide (TPR) repeat protein